MFAELVESGLAGMAVPLGSCADGRFPISGYCKSGTEPNPGYCQNGREPHGGWCSMGYN